ncbi:MAG: hypothetical protein KF687_17715 [Cyclobacteriaceae bacterium]|nr:hypothetical protein [Cyclobacteriaceae bacterium]
MDCKNVILFCFLSAGIFSVEAQQRLVMLKGNKIITSFYEGDYIRFKRKDRDHFTVGLIGGLTLDYFRTGQDTTYLYQLEKVDLSEREKGGFQTRQIGAMLIVSGVVLFLGDMVNETLVNDRPYTVDNGVLAVSVAMVGTGALMQFLNNDNFVFGRRKKAVVMGW